MGIKSLRAWILTASLLVFSFSAQAAGLGRLTVKSALGEPLAAEIELFTAGKELDTLSARLAGPESFGRAGLIYTPALAGVNVSIEKHASGKSFVQITSAKAFNEPFVDLLIELTWASGRVSREFTALLDPPAIIAERARQKAAEAQVRAAPKDDAPQAEPMPAPEVPAGAEVAAATDAPSAPPATEPSAGSEPVAQEPSPEQQFTGPTQTIGGTAPTMFDQRVRESQQETPSGDEYGPVKRGDTLGKIARSAAQSGVSLDQMLVLLFRKNAHAFSGRNMNRLKTGKILQLPSSEELASVTQPAARKEVLAQARDWNAYRDKLAAMNADAPPPEPMAEQSAAGTVTTTVTEPAMPGQEAPKEVLKLSKADAAGPQGANDRTRAQEEEALAREKELREANERIAKLDKQVKDLRDLLELKSSKVAPDKPASPPPVQTNVNPAPAPAPAPAAPVVSNVSPTVEPVPPAPAPEPQAAPAPPPAAAKPRPAPRPPAPEPSLVDKIIGMVMDQATYIAAGVGALVLIGGLVLVSRKIRRRRESKSDTEDAGPANFSGRDVSEGAPGVAARGASVAALPDADEVDPVAEAEIFLAYGRDAQAEDLLTEALASAPRRLEIHVKLLEIYAKRKDAKSFEKIARELQNGTGGSGPLWDQAVMLGIQVDPDNPRYAAGKAMAAQPGSASGPQGSAENVDFDVGPGTGGTNTTTDFNIGDSPSPNNQVFDPGGGTMRMATPTLAQLSTSRNPAPSGPMDFDISGMAMDGPDSAKETSVMDFDVAGSADDRVEKPASVSNVMDFDVSGLALGSAEPAAAKGGTDFDISGLSLGSIETSLKVEPSAAPPEFDLSGISLDLGGEPSAKPPASDGKDDHWYDVQTKFDLAKAYQEMGDKDGASDILKEVLQEGDAEQKSAAQSLLASLSA